MTVEKLGMLKSLSFHGFFFEVKFFYSIKTSIFFSSFLPKALKYFFISKSKNEYHKIQLRPAQPVSQGLEESVLLPWTQARGFESLKKMLKFFLLVGKVECNLFSDQVDSNPRPSGLQKTPVPASQPAFRHPPDGSTCRWFSIGCFAEADKILIILKTRQWTLAWKADWTSLTKAKQARKVTSKVKDLL